MEQKPQQGNSSDVIKVRYEKLDALKEAGRDPFVITTSDRDILTETIKNNFEEYENKDVCVAGRLLSKRGKGKVSFMDLWDRSGKIQIFAKFDDLGEEEYGFLKKWDIGDIVEIKGFVFKTQMGEISVHAKEVKLLSKSLKPLPEKYHGLTNTDLRYRQRYVDLIMNPEVKDTFIKRSKIISTIRKYLDSQGFMEVETPMLVSNAGGASARPFETHFNALDEDLKLRISLELYLKRLIVGGLEKVYEIGRVFRNEGLDTRHNPEFTLMELYQAYTDYHGMMDLTENLYRHVAQEVLGTTTIVYNGIEMDLGKPFERITMVDAVKKYAGVDFNEIHTLEEARAVAKEKGVEYEERHKKGDILNLFFEAFVEEHLIQPTFLMDHPIEISPLILLLLLKYIRISFSMHRDAYVASLMFLLVSYVLIAFISPIVPIDIKSSIPVPVFSNFLAMYTTSLKFLSTSSCRVSLSPCANFFRAFASSSAFKGGGNV